MAFKKTFSYAGFEQQPKSFVNPKILCLNVELELKAERDNAEIKIDNPEVWEVCGVCECDSGFFPLLFLLSLWFLLPFSKIAIQQFQSLVDAEWRILYEKMEKMITSGANIILSKLPIGKIMPFSLPSDLPSSVIPTSSFPPILTSHHST